MSEQTAATSGRCVITVLGSDRAGIVAAVAGALARHEANILDISQTILKGAAGNLEPFGNSQGVFTMTMIVDLAPSDVQFADLDAEFEALSAQLGVKIQLVREDVFQFMYRL